MTPEDGRAVVGSVAEEAAGLLEQLSAWTASGRFGRAERDGDHGDSRDCDHDGNSVSDGDGDGDGDGKHDHGGHDHGEDRSAGPTCSHCGAREGVGRASTCQVCPLCQGIALLRLVRPETVDRLADLAGAVADSLRAAAEQRRGAPQNGSRGPTPGSTEPSTPGHGRHTAVTEQIRVTNGDVLHDDVPETDPVAGNTTTQPDTSTDQGARA